MDKQTCASLQLFYILTYIRYLIRRLWFINGGILKVLTNKANTVLMEKFYRMDVIITRELDMNYSLDRATAKIPSSSG